MALSVKGNSGIACEMLVYKPNPSFLKDLLKTLNPVFLAILMDEMLGSRIYSRFLSWPFRMKQKLQGPNGLVSTLPNISFSRESSTEAVGFLSACKIYPSSQTTFGLLARDWDLAYRTVSCNQFPVCAGNLKQAQWFLILVCCFLKIVSDNVCFSFTVIQKPFVDDILQVKV